MKRILCITFVLFAAAVSAKAQVVPHYGETYEKETGKLRGKAWVSALGFRQETPDENGKTSILIYRIDSAKVYIVDMEKKTWLSFSLSQITDGTLSGIRALERENHNVKRTLINQETVEGKNCNHYRVETATLLKGGTTDYADWEEWIYEPDKMWIQRSDDLRAGYYLVHRNIRMGAQPAHLFDIPRDFKGSELPMGGMLEMFTGKAQDGNSGPATLGTLAGSKEEQEVLKGKTLTVNELMQQMKEAEKIEDPQKRQQEMMRIMLEMNELSKKK